MPRPIRQFYHRKSEAKSVIGDVVLDPRQRLSPLSESELQKLDELAVIHCSDWEIAYSLGMTYKAWKAFVERYPELEQRINEGKARGSKSLRLVQMKSALNGNTAMMMWLGREVLGQNQGGTTNLNITDSESITDISPEAKKHLEDLTKVIYNNPQLRESNTIEIEAKVVDNLSGNGDGAS